MFLVLPSNVEGELNAACPACLCACVPSLSSTKYWTVTSTSVLKCFDSVLIVEYSKVGICSGWLLGERFGRLSALPLMEPSEVWLSESTLSWRFHPTLDEIKLVTPKGHNHLLQFDIHSWTAFLHNNLKLIIIDSFQPSSLTTTDCITFMVCRNQMRHGKPMLSCLLSYFAGNISSCERIKISGRSISDSAAMVLSCHVRISLVSRSLSGRWVKIRYPSWARSSANRRMIIIHPLQKLPCVAGQLTT